MSKSQAFDYGRLGENEFFDKLMSRYGESEITLIGGATNDTDIKMRRGGKTVNIEVKQSRCTKIDEEYRAFQFYLFGNGRSKPVDDDVIALGCDTGEATIWFIIPAKLVRGKKKIAIANVDDNKWSDYRERWDVIETLLN